MDKRNDFLRRFLFLCINYNPEAVLYILKKWIAAYTWELCGSLETSSFDSFIPLTFRQGKHLTFLNTFLLKNNKNVLSFDNNLNLATMSKTNKFVFWGLYIVAWLIFVGLSIEAGGLTVNFFFSLYKPEFVQNLYQKLDLTEMYNSRRLAFFGTYGFILTISILKACLFYTVITLMHKMDFSKPFHSFVSRQISKISYYTLSIGLLSYIARQFVKNLVHHSFVPDNLNQFWADSQAFILMGAVIYIIATIFKKGVDIQNENDLTV
ncbi:DUF2975 domain-containing protein [Arcticibacter tournemirensis]|nr:DUF2975 domain-containing protein [Arcticibacter tournemirensis]